MASTLALRPSLAAAVTEILPATATDVFSAAQLETETREYMAQFRRDQGRDMTVTAMLAQHRGGVPEPGERLGGNRER